MSHRIQGGVGEMIRVAMQELDRIINDPEDGRLAGVHMLLQVHDSVLFEVPEKNLDETTIETIREIMEMGPDNILRHTWEQCPPRVDVKIGYSWGDTKVVGRASAEQNLSKSSNETDHGNRRVVRR
jgi:DNA polymerase-1